MLNKRSQRTRFRGFTLIELLVVIAIISLLSSVVLAALNAARDKANLGAGKQMASQIDRVEGDQAVAIWHFDECSGATSADASNNGNTAALMGSPLPSWSTDTPFNLGCSISLNGTNQYLTAADSNSLDIGTNDLTIVAWVKTIGAGNQRLVTKRFGALGMGYSLVIAAGGVPYIEILNTSTYITASAPTAVNDGKWHFVAGIISRSGNGYVCVDGRCGTAVSFAPMASNDLSNTLNCDIGTITTGAGGYLAGLIDEVRIFTKAFTAKEVGKLYAADLERTKPVNVALGK